MKLSIVIGGIALSAAACGPKAAPHGGAGPKAAPPTFFTRWHHVFEAGHAFSMQIEDDDGAVAAVLEGTVDDVRAVGDAAVARLSWKTGAPGALQPVTLQIPGGPGLGQIAEDARGVAFFAADASDDAIAAALASPDTWMYPEPTEAQDWNVDGPHGENVHVGTGEGGMPVACYSVPAVGECPEDAMCGGWVCVTDDDGVVRVGGQLGPDGNEYRAPVPASDEE